jgi:hypothetical protein
VTICDPSSRSHDGMSGGNRPNLLFSAWDYTSMVTSAGSLNVRAAEGWPLALRGVLVLFWVKIYCTEYIQNSSTSSSGDSNSKALTWSPRSTPRGRGGQLPASAWPAGTPPPRSPLGTIQSQSMGQQVVNMSHYVPDRRSQGIATSVIGQHESNMPVTKTSEMESKPRV